MCILLTLKEFIKYNAQGSFPEEAKRIETTQTIAKPILYIICMHKL